MICTENVAKGVVPKEQLQIPFQNTSLTLASLRKLAALIQYEYISIVCIIVNSFYLQRTYNVYNYIYTYILQWREILPQQDCTLHVKCHCKGICTHAHTDP